MLDTELVDAMRSFFRDVIYSSCNLLFDIDYINVHVPVQI